MIFQYSIIPKGSNQTIKGRVEANNRDAAIKLLQDKGATVVSISEKKNTLSVEIFKQRISQKEIVIFTRQLATLFEARIPTFRAIVLMVSQIENKRLKGITGEIAEDIKRGASVSNAFGKHDEIFSPFYVNMISAGEESGNLNITLNYLADHLESSHETTSKIKGALVYPVFILITFGAVLWLLFGFVIPQIGGIIQDTGQELPLITEIVLGISNLVTNNTLLLFLLITAFIAGVIKYATTPGGKDFFDILKVKTPLIGRLFKQLYLSRISSTISLMLKSGVRLIKAIRVTALVVDNKVYRDALNDAAEKVKGGASLSAVFATNDEFPQLMTQMTRIGEETGEMSSMLGSVTGFYDRALKETIDSILKLIEPILIILLGGAVSVLLASVLLPIYSISNQL